VSRGISPFIYGKGVDMLAHMWFDECMNTTSPTEISFFANHETNALRSIVEIKTSESLYMATTGAPEMADAAMSIANAAWGQLVLRGEA
jgi:hypothetical protein